MKKRIVLLIGVCLITLISIAQTDKERENWFSSINSGDLQQIKSLLKDNSDYLQMKGEKGRDALHLAVRNENLEVIALLIDKGADVNALDKNFTSPLLSAVVRNSNEIISLLIEKGANINYQKPNSLSILHYATMYSNANTIELLLEQGADVDIIGMALRTPLLWCAREVGDLEKIKILIKYGANVDQLDEYGETSVELAAWKGFKDIVLYLLEKDAYLNPEHDEKMIKYSLNSNIPELFFKLINRIDIHKTSNKGKSYLHYAAAGGSIEICKYLLENGIKVNILDYSNWTPLHYAAYRNMKEVARFLVDNGASLNKRTAAGQTAYNLADFYKNIDVKNFLETKRCDKSIVQFPELYGKYLGQTKTKKGVELFAPGIISSSEYKHHTSLLFSPNGNECILSPSVSREGYADDLGMLIRYKFDGKKWNTSDIPGYADINNSEDVPYYTPDGKRVYFHTKSKNGVRDISGDKKIWYTENVKSKWQDPKPAEGEINNYYSHWQFSLDENYNIYLVTTTDKTGIHISRFVNGKYLKPEILSEHFVGHMISNVFISPRANYIIFAQNVIKNEKGDMDLFISYKADETWTKVMPLNNINSENFETCPVVTPDGKYLFFISERNNFEGIYWVETDFIEELRLKE